VGTRELAAPLPGAPPSTTQAWTPSASRLRGWAAAAALLQALVLAFMIAGTHGWLVAGVKPNTTDYVSFWAAGKLADQGRPELAYNRSAHLRVEEAATAAGIGYQYFFNPPPYLMIMAPLARLPYLASFLLMQALTLPLWLLLGTRVAGGGGTATLCLLAVPSLWWVIGLGQNAFLSASLMAAGMLLLAAPDRLPSQPFLAGRANPQPVEAGQAPVARKLMAGAMFGLLCYKPHLGLLIPVALLAAGEWAALASASVTVAGIVALTVALFGIGSWSAFLAMMQQNLGGAIDHGVVLFAGRVDPTGALQQLGLPAAAARLAWVACLLACVVIVAAVWRRGSADLRCAVLASCVVIAAPFALFYDLVMCSLAACWLVRSARRDGFLPGEALVLILLVVADLLAAPMMVARSLVPWGALVAPALLALCLRRWWIASRAAPAL
jgi:alpha-1,2-mannosyltransferase